MCVCERVMIVVCDYIIQRSLLAFNLSNALINLHLVDSWKKKKIEQTVRKANLSDKIRLARARSELANRVKNVTHHMEVYFFIVYFIA